MLDNCCFALATILTTLHKLWWGGCKRLTSGHEIAGTVSGVEAAIHCGDEL